MTTEQYIEQCRELGIHRGNLEEGKNIDRMNTHGKGHERQYLKKVHHSIKSAPVMDSYSVAQSIVEAAQ